MNLYTLRSNMTKKPKISRPINCFMAFRSEKYQEIASRTLGINNRDISRIIAKWWKQMSEEQKAPYRAIAMKAKEDHELRYPNYTYHPIKKSQRKVRPYHRREDAKTRQDKAQKNEQKLKKWLGEDSDIVPSLSPTLQSLPTSPFSSADSNVSGDFNMFSPFLDFTCVDNDFQFLPSDLFSSCDPFENTNACSPPPPQSPPFFSLDTCSSISNADPLFVNPVDLMSDWTNPSIDIMTSPTLVSPDLISLENFLLS